MGWDGKAENIDIDSDNDDFADMTCQVYQADLVVER